MRWPSRDRPRDRRGLVKPGFPVPKTAVYEAVPAEAW
jgi:hypothetical protein